MSRQARIHPTVEAQKKRIQVITLNMHKGLSTFHANSTIYRTRQKMRQLHPDLVFIQEVQQEHRGRVQRFHQWPTHELTDFLAEGFWPDWHYGKNAEYRQGHHGNAILSQYTLTKGRNYDISAYRFESRGLLHSTLKLAPNQPRIHCFCVHLALFERGRERQLKEIISYIDQLTQGLPCIVAGDFNDWRNRFSQPMHEAGFKEVFETLTGSPARTFPSRMPILTMDRIYVRGFKVLGAEVLYEWEGLSDHLALSTELEFL